MSRLAIEKYAMPSASLGKPNPLPNITAKQDAHQQIQYDETTITADEARYMGWGRVNGILPYLIQDNYDRHKKPRDWNAAVIENDHIRATFMPQLGGRLWSLIDKHTGRELLHRNPVFQPANLALRNAWISGGVEWNLGIIGHTPFTVDDLFTEFLELDDGTPVLRMFQYERVRGLVYRIEAILPDDSHQLYVRVRIDNTTKDDTAVYWWSNMAVDEREDVRVIVPATRTFRFGYGGKLTKEPVPYQTLDAANMRPGAFKTLAEKNGGKLDVDVSKTTTLPQAMDCFFDLPDGQRRWIAAIGGDGYGFAQTSTDVLQGRKLFVWGMGAGGRNWQTFLAAPGHAYIEIQAGLAHTQLEHLPMKGGEVISWMEAYGPVSADPAAVHGADWAKATGAVEASLEAACPRAKVEAMHERAKAEIDGKSGKLVHTGMGWARVQQALLGDAFTAGGLNFPDSCLSRKAEKRWVTLVKTGVLPCPDPLELPDSYQIGEKWKALVEAAIRSGKSDDWHAHYQLGVMQAHESDFEGAKASFKASLEKARSPWALRCLASLAQLEKKNDEAAQLLLEAVEMLPQRNLAIEAVQALCVAGRYKDAADVIARLPESVQKLGRIRTMYIEALIELGELEKAEKMLKGPIELTDVREGEVKLTDMWFKLCALKRVRDSGAEMNDALIEKVKLECPPPKHIDFRMS